VVRWREISGEMAENYLLNATGNGGHIAGSFSWFIPSHEIPG